MECDAASDTEPFGELRECRPPRTITQDVQLRIRRARMHRLECANEGLYMLLHREPTGVHIEWHLLWQAQPRARIRYPLEPRRVHAMRNDDQTLVGRTRQVPP